MRACQVSLFAISTDPPDRNRAFAASLDLRFPILSDPTGQTARAYGVRGLLPWASRWTFYIDTLQRIALIDRAVSPATAGETIAGHLHALGLCRSPARPTSSDG